jgi:predicted nucleic acid-binding protein
MFYECGCGVKGMIRIAYLIDTWTWIEYFDKNPTDITDIINGDDLVFTSIISLTEIMTLFARKKSVQDGHVAVSKVMRLSHIVPITTDIAIHAGLYKKKEFPGGTADRLIYATAELNGLTICMGDEDFRNISGVHYLGK